MPRVDPFAVTSGSKKKKADPFPFVLDELEPLDPTTRPMFGCLAIYVGAKIVFILRDKGPADPDNGVWVTSEPEHVAALTEELPRLEPIELFADRIAGWKKLSSRSPEFEDDVLHACSLVRKHDPRIGKIPKAKKKALGEQATPAEAAPERRATKPTKKVRTSPTKAAAEAAKQGARTAKVTAKAAKQGRASTAKAAKQSRTSAAKATSKAAKQGRTTKARATTKAPATTRAKGAATRSAKKPAASDRAAKR